MSIKSKFLTGVLVVAIMFVGFVAVGANKAAADCSITSTLRLGSKGAQVVCLQTALGGLTADGNFGPKTKAAVMAWQTKEGLVADGVFGPKSNAVWVSNAGNSANFPAGCSSSVGFSTTTGLACSGGANLPVGCSSTAGYSPTTGQSCSATVSYPAGCTSNTGYSPTTGKSCAATSGPLTGGAGSVDTYALASGVSNETVGEGQTDVKVLGLEITPSTGSDLSVTAMKLVFDPGASTGKFIKYATDVSVWSGSTLLARVPAADFTSSNSYTQTVSFTAPAVIKAGVKGTIYVAVSGASTIDSLLQGDSWTLDVTSVRWADAQGALISEDPGTATRTMTFDKASTGTSTTVQISEGDDSLDTSHVVQISNSSKTNDVSILSFKMKVLGTSPVYLDSLPVTLTSTGGNVDDVVSGGLTLAMDGNSIGSADLSSDALHNGALSTDYGASHTTAGYRFTKLATVMQPGTHTFTVSADFNSEADMGGQGDTIQGVFGQTEITYSYFDLTLGSNGNGDSIATSDITGGETADAIAFYSKGISVTLVGTPTSVVSPGDATVPTSDQGTFAITFDVAAFGSDVYIDHSAPAVEAAGGNSESSLTQLGTLSGTPVATITSPSGATDGAQGYKVADSSTQRFTITTNITASAANGFYGVALNDLRYALTDVDATTSYIFGLKTFKTPQIFLNHY